MKGQRYCLLCKMYRIHWRCEGSWDRPRRRSLEWRSKEENIFKSKYYSKGAYFASQTGICILIKMVKFFKLIIRNPSFKSFSVLTILVNGNAGISAACRTSGLGVQSAKRDTWARRERPHALRSCIALVLCSAKPPVLQASISARS